MKNHPEILAKSGPGEPMSLFEHLQTVGNTATVIADKVNLDSKMARKGGLLHDIGKTSPIFQHRLFAHYSPEWEPFRHEIASLFFLPLFPEAEWPVLIEMIAGHHKSIVKDARELGLVDLDYRFETGVAFEIHSHGFDEWSVTALDILEELGLAVRPIQLKEAHMAYDFAFRYCCRLQKGCSRWKGLLMAADYFASALGRETNGKLATSFQVPELAFYNRPNSLYPLSEFPAEVEVSHTLVTAPTGAGKTDFLLRRCRRRVFYTLPFQASINAMYQRFVEDLGPETDIRLLHASSEIILQGKTREEHALQNLVGSSIKVLTPHQLAGIVFGTKGYEALLLDLAGNDVILDEIHTYTEVSQAIVLKLIEILKSMNCRIHVGTATMPSLLYQHVRELLGQEVYEVKLPKAQLETFNRHVIHKLPADTAALPVIKKGLSEGQKVIVVVNRVKKAQEWYGNLKKAYPHIPIMLIHSRFKREERARLEEKLKNKFNSSSGPCLVISTQVVEVSLDISFDVMVTETAPIDSLIQRFGRVNRVRRAQTLGQLKPVYIIAPPELERDAKPYSLVILQRSFAVLPDNEVLAEKEIQNLLDQVYTELDVEKIESQAIFRQQEWWLKLLAHQPKSALLDMLAIDSAVCVCRKDVDVYRQGTFADRLKLEIPSRLWALVRQNLPQLDLGHRPFVIPDGAYSVNKGLEMEKLSSKSANGDNFI